MKLTTASKITIVRVLLIPAVIVLMYLDFDWHMYCALAVFVIASVSDFVDGYIARHYHQVSNFGKFLDPLADKLLVISVMLVFVDMGLFPAWAAIIVVARELAVTGLRLVAVEGGKVIAAAWSGKIKTASTMVCFILLMLPVPEWTVTACWVVVVATTVYSGIEYFVKNADCFKYDGKTRKENTQNKGPCPGAAGDSRALPRGGHNRFHHARERRGHAAAV